MINFIFNYSNNRVIITNITKSDRLTKHTQYYVDLSSLYFGIKPIFIMKAIYFSQEYNH